MGTTIAVVAAGAMGAGVGARLAERGARVLTSVAGRSQASVVRAKQAGMVASDDAALAGADLFLSIVPPDQAAPLASRMAAACMAAGTRPVYVDCNAISPHTAAAVAEILAPAGLPFIDGGIIGGPPKGDDAGPTFYLAGPAADCAVTLRGFGLVTKQLEGGIGAASALKMSYAGITKGMTALGAAMILAAERAGVDRALHAELAISQKEVLARLARGVPDMLPKAYRWVPEMREIAGFIGEERPESAIYQAIAELYQVITTDLEGDRSLAGTLEGFFKP